MWQSQHPGRIKGADFSNLTEPQPDKNSLYDFVKRLIAIQTFLTCGVVSFALFKAS